mgnify:CR=1 FL=1
MGAMRPTYRRLVHTHDIQLSKPCGTITVDENIVTEDSPGYSLVWCKVDHPEAHGLSLKPGTEGKSIKVTGQVIARNQAISDFDFVAPASVIRRIGVGRKQIG